MYFLLLMCTKPKPEGGRKTHFLVIDTIAQLKIFCITIMVDVPTYIAQK